MPLAEAEQVSASAGSGTLSARAPGQTPTMPMPFSGAAATAAVAVPCRLSSGRPPSVAMLAPRELRVGRVRRASTSAISGLVRRDRRRREAGSTTAARQAFGGPDSGSSGTRLPASRRIASGSA